MSQSPMLWGAGLACALGGAIAGTTLGSSPLIAAGTSTAYYQSHSSENGPLDADARVLPDHYPLVTRQGTVPVAQLSDRGLYSQARYRALYAPTDPTGRFALAEVPMDEPRFQYADQSEQVGDAQSPSQSAENRSDRDAIIPPLALTDGPATLPEVANGSAKLVNVSATLAMR